jgi:hypothetical protein
MVNTFNHAVFWSLYMAKRDFMPRKDGVALAFHDQFTSEMVAKGAALGFSPAEIAEVVADNAAFHADFTNATVTKAAAKAAVKKKDATRRAADARVRAFGRRITAGEGYDVARGKSFGIVGHEPSVNLREAKPKLHGKDLGRGRVQLRYNKSISQGVNIYSQRGDETEWKLLTRDLRPPAFDERPLLVAGKPELRRYRCRYVVRDEEIGDWSNVTVVSCAP